jgi:hypothetical protein
MKKDKLHNIKATGFKTPEHYFEDLTEKVFERMKDHDSIGGIKTSGYLVPQNYFNTFDAKILSQLNAEAKPVIRLQSRTTFYTIAGIAASLLLFITLVFNSSKTTSIDTLETSFLERYLLQELVTYDELATLFENDDISVTDFIDINISDETLDFYLENTDTEDLFLD